MSISICNAKNVLIGLQILILKAAGFFRPFGRKRPEVERLRPFGSKRRSRAANPAEQVFCFKSSDTQAVGFENLVERGEWLRNVFNSLEFLPKIHVLFVGVHVSNKILREEKFW